MQATADILAGTRTSRLTSRLVLQGRQLRSVQVGWLEEGSV
jgi:hypothetical protein